MVRRVPLAAAVAFAVLGVVAVVVVPLGPGIERPGAEVVEYIGAHAPMIRLRALLTALALLAIVVIVGFARDRLAGPAGYIFTVGAAVLVAQVGLQVWFSAGLALHPATLEPATARTLSDIVSMSGPLLAVAAILLAGPVVWAGRRGSFPRWMSLIAAVVVVERFVELLTIIGPVGSFIAPGGPMNVFGGGTLFGVFLFALGLASGMPDREPSAVAPDQFTTA